MEDKVPSGRGEFKPVEIPPATFEAGSLFRKIGEVTAFKIHTGSNITDARRAFMEKAKIVVIGAGIVGLAIAAKLSELNDGVLVLEKNKKHGQETSSHNSGVIHSGIHYPNGSLKAMLCVGGNSMIYETCRRYGLPYKRLGKLTVATGETEIRELERLMKMGEGNGVDGLRMLDGNEVSRMEPNIHVERALYTPSTGILEPDDLMQHFLGRINENGASVSLETEVTGLKSTGSDYEISGVSSNTNFTIRADTVINCAGLNADRVAAMVGLDVDKLGYRQHYYKGDYFRITGKAPVNMLVYPVPKGAGLGIHLTPDMAGSVKMGPNAYPVKMIDYRVESSEEEFRKDVQRFLPSISNRTIQPDSSGIRPKLNGSEGGFADFVIRHEADRDLFGFINLIGIESPGLTSSPAIAEYVSEIYENEIRT
ncbi:MAG: NAD(P)/FAD-dependent oxidoreductase [Candidatus Thermoplasmatota archaeon]|nr:NAD(P)/FAD-dependent oxidoreductase [Candidatus Thermoplasmatota archaeon]